jgi:MurNAc alpha-1-phosphate uridylyltransferase
MRALIFAAGRGSRMRELTEQIPKPLLRVRGKALIQWQVESLARAGIRRVVINLSWLGEQIRTALGDGSELGVHIDYSDEGSVALETGGGMLAALPLLGTDPFVAVNADVWTDFDYARLPAAPTGLAHLVLVDNPPQHPQGDFELGPDGRLHAEPKPQSVRLTFAGIGVYRPELLAGHAPGVFPLAPILRTGILAGQVSAERHGGQWSDVGTPERLALLNG